MRLFTAIELPDAIKMRLVDLQPAPATGIRLVAAPQLHLTLHFLGQADPDVISKALAAANAQPFTVKLRGAGHFRGRDRAVTLWSGIEPSNSLTKLHAGLTALLLPTGFKPESRPFSPHITLARCSSVVPQAIIRHFLEEHANAHSGEWEVRQFGLWSSTMGTGPPVYRQERAFPLTKSDDDD